MRRGRGQRREPASSLELPHEPRWPRDLGSVVILGANVLSRREQIQQRCAAADRRAHGCALWRPSIDRDAAARAAGDQELLGTKKAAAVLAAVANEVARLD